MPASGGRLGVNEPPPAAMTTTLQMNSLPASVLRRKRPSGSRSSSSTRSPRWNCGAERLDLLQQPVGELLPGDDRQPGNVVDRLFGIELGALAARLVEDVDDVRLDVDEPQLEHGKQADGAGADDHGIGLDRAAGLRRPAPRRS